MGGEQVTLRVGRDQMTGGYDTVTLGVVMHHDYHVIAKLADGSFLVRPSHHLVPA